MPARAAGGNKPAPAPAKAAAPKPLYYKDFAKASSDVIRKNFSAADTWKIESKFKGPAGAFYVNPTAFVGAGGGKSSVSADLEYRAVCNATVKLNVSPDTDLLNTVKAGKVPDNYKLTAAYDFCGQHAELILSGKGGNTNVEAVHQCLAAACPALPNVIASTDAKVTREFAELGLATSVAPHCYLGASGQYNYKSRECRYSFGVRYCDPTVLRGSEVTVQAINQAQNIKTNLLLPLGALLDTYVLSKCPAKDFFKTIRLSAETVCPSKRGSGAGIQWAVGAELPCPARPADAIKCSFNDKKEWNTCYVFAVNSSWTAAVSIDQALKPGVLFTHN